jgi:NADPH:quinone reductase-like Zn-dependent oxidoreductase
MPGAQDSNRLAQEIVIMKAIVLHEYGSPENLRYEDAPDPAPKAGEVLVRVHATSVNPVDWMHRSGAIRAFLPITFPYILGLDVAGTVEALGEGVTGFSVGDRVMAVARHAYAELCVAPANLVAKVPDGLELTTAAALPLVTVTGDQLARVAAKVAPGKTVLVTGALGGVGRSAVFAAVESGAKVIAGVRGRRVSEAKKLPGVADAVALDDDDAIAALPRLDGVADAVGHEVAKKVIQKVKPGGAFGCFPGARDAVATRSDLEVKMLVAALDGATTRRYAEAVAAGKLVIPVASVLPLAEASEGHRLAEAGAGGKIVLRVA